MNRLPAFCVLDFAEQITRLCSASPREFKSRRNSGKQKNKEQLKGYSLFCIITQFLIRVASGCKVAFIILGCIWNATLILQLHTSNDIHHK
jgi:hypothetical protein